jgi:transcriptional regulator with XRE-family HTH domain
MPKKKTPQLFEEQLRSAIRESGKSAYRLAKESGVHSTQISRFIKADRSLDMPAINSLCEVLNLKLTERKD